MPGVLHALLAGAWIGTVLVEALFERALLGQGRDKELILARLHWKVDLLVELPLLVLVATTGAMLLQGRAITGLLAIKLIAAGVAIMANLYCTWLVWQRLHAAEQADWGRFEALDHSQHIFGAVVLAGLIAAAAIGLAA